MKRNLIQSLVGQALLCLASTCFAAVMPLPGSNNIDVQVSNAGGALYGSGPDDTYLVASSLTLNNLHITTDNTLAGIFGQVTARTISTSSASGTIWVTTTGGRGFQDDVILLFSLIGPVADDFSLHIKSSGYQWTPSSSGVSNPVYKTGAVDEVFTKSDFLYGPQTSRPGPDSGLPFFSGQNVSDPLTAQYIMFIDLEVGVTNVRTDNDVGDAKVEFEIAGISDTTASFNAYGWSLSSNIANDAINTTNLLSENSDAVGQSGYSITTTALAAIPVPGSPALIGLAIAALGWSRRKK